MIQKSKILMHSKSWLIKFKNQDSLQSAIKDTRKLVYNDSNAILKIVDDNYAIIDQNSKDIDQPHTILDHSVDKLDRNEYLFTSPPR